MQSPNRNHLKNSQNYILRVVLHAMDARAHMELHVKVVSPFMYLETY